MLHRAFDQQRPVTRGHVCTQLKVFKSDFVDMAKLWPEPARHHFRGIGKERGTGTAVTEFLGLPSTSRSV